MASFRDEEGKRNALIESPLAAASFFLLSSAAALSNACAFARSACMAS